MNGHKLVSKENPNGARETNMLVSIVFFFQRCDFESLIAEIEQIFLPFIPEL